MTVAFLKKEGILNNYLWLQRSSWNLLY